MILYDYDPSQNGWKVRCLARILGVHLERRLVSIFEGESHTSEFVAHRNPAGAVPVLELDDGRCIAESNAILCLLARGTPLLPEEPYLHAKTLQWLFFELDYVQSSIGTLRHWVLTGKSRHEAVLGMRRDAGVRALRMLDGHLSRQPWLVECGFTIADIAVYAYSHLATDAGIDPAPFAAFNAWTARLRAEHGPLPEVVPYSVDPHSHRELV